jgi:hypothetical protein
MRHWPVSHIYLAVVLSMAVATAAYSSDRFPSREWQRAASPSDAGWSEQKLALAREFVNKLDTAAVMIIHDGLVIDEWGVTALRLQSTQL